jgi:hypothetical protein
MFTSPHIKKPSRLAALLFLLCLTVLATSYPRIARAIRWRALNQSPSSQTSAFNTWTSSGPEGPAVLSVAIDPVNSNVVYIATADGVFKSTDGGQHWLAVNSGIPVNAHVDSLAINQKSPNVVLAGLAGFGIWRSDDSGMNWSRSDEGLHQPLINELVFDPYDAAIAYAVTNGDAG